MEEVREKMRRAGRVMGVTAWVLCGLLVLEMLAAVVALIWYLQDPVGVYWGLLPMDGLLLARMCTSLVFSGFTLGVGLRFTALFGSIRQGESPFAERNARRLKTIGITVLVASVVVPTLYKTFLMSFAPAMSLSGENFHTLPFVALGLLFFFFSWVFGYGAALQRQSDETL